MMAHQYSDAAAKLVEKKITSFGIELLPRISRVQSIEACSSQISVARHKAAIMGSDLSNRLSRTGHGNQTGNDDVIANSVLIRNGEIIHAPMRELVVIKCGQGAVF